MLRSEQRGAGDLFVLRGLARSHGLGQCHSTLLLKPDEYHLLQIELPAVPPEEMKEAIRWKIKDMIDLPVESLTLDLAEIPGIAGRAGRVRQGLVAAASDALVAERMGLFDSAGVALEVIDIPEMAIRNIAALFEEPDRGLAVLVIDEERSLMIFTFRGELYAVRQIEIARGKLEESEGEWRQQMFDRIGLETQRSLDNFERLHSHISVTRVMLSPLPTVPGLMEHLREYLSLPVSEMNLAEVLDFSLIPELSQPGRQAQYLQVLGAALRE
ncbi:MAG: pilus assembly protein PilM [Sterolibacterium sp.]|nr:pilus assembly protein PilM [Sterolibacterium sp.]